MAEDGFRLKALEAGFKVRLIKPQKRAELNSLLGGIEIATASNGREAFDYLHEHELPDLVLLDVCMPEVDDPTFLKSVRDDIRLHNLRVFVVSSSSRSELEPNTLSIDGWFSKPVRIDALLQAVRAEHSPVTATA